MPFVIPLFDQRLALRSVKLIDDLERVARDEGSSAKESCVLGHAVRLGESTGIDHSLLWRSALVEGRESALTLQK